MNDNKYLQQRGNTWYLRIRKPPKAWGLPGEFIHTLKTSNVIEARKVRDMYLIPILAETKGLEMAETILKLIAGADEQIKQKLQNLGAFLGDDSQDITVSQAFDLFITFKKRVKSKDSTLEVYETCKKSLLSSLTHDKFIDDITTRDITDWRNMLLDMPNNWMKIENPEESTAPKLSSTTINNQLSRFSSVWNWAKTEKYIKGKLINPAEGIRAGISSRVRTDEEITVEECDALMKMAFPRNAQSFDAKIWQFLPIMARYTGARLAELAQLTTDDIKEFKGYLCIDINDDHGKSLKNKQSKRSEKSKN